MANTIREVPGDTIRFQLINLINELIKNDFPSLIQLLYRIDVEEKKLKKLLQDNPGSDAATIIADIIIKRQIQKVITKKQFKAKDNPSREGEW
ncbi:MAG: hypothetical protein ACRDE5_11460 [Ginsengibacter sp.]